MSEPKFTQDEWRAIEGYKDKFLAVQIGSQGGFVVQGTDTDQAIANAHLIAAAPEMYKFIESLQLSVEDDMKREHLLAKARGEQK